MSFAEGLIVGEWKDSYKFLVEAMYDMAPNADKSRAEVIASDLFLDEDFPNRVRSSPPASRSHLACYCLTMSRLVVNCRLRWVQQPSSGTNGICWSLCCPRTSSAALERPCGRV